MPVGSVFWGLSCGTGGPSRRLHGCGVAWVEHARALFGWCARGWRQDLPDPSARRGHVQKPRLSILRGAEKAMGPVFLLRRALSLSLRDSAFPAVGLVLLAKHSEPVQNEKRDERHGAGDREDGYIALTQECWVERQFRPRGARSCVAASPPPSGRLEIASARCKEKGPSGSKALR